VGVCVTDHGGVDGGVGTVCGICGFTGDGGQGTVVGKGGHGGGEGSVGGVGGVIEEGVSVVTVVYGLSVLLVTSIV